MNENPILWTQRMRQVEDVLALQRLCGSVVDAFAMGRVFEVEPDDPLFPGDQETMVAFHRRDMFDEWTRLLDWAEAFVGRWRNPPLSDAEREEARKLGEAMLKEHE